MKHLKSLIEQLRASGFDPKVNLIVAQEAPDIEGLEHLNEQLLSVGISPEVHINLSVGGGISPQPEVSQDVTRGKSTAVVVSDDKLNCFIFKSRDGAGKPIFFIREPRVQLFRGDSLLVSAERRESEKDPGDGTILGTGNIRMYYVVDCPSKPEAVGMYVRQSEVTLV
jgi:hypothetical protein